MTWNMVLFSEFEALRKSLQFLAFSDAYLDSAELLCRAIADRPESSNYAKGAVIMYLSFHGTELFLKAAILEKHPNQQFTGPKGHNLGNLGKQYSELYPGDGFDLQVPFQEEVKLMHPDPEIIKEIQRRVEEYKEATPTDQLHRYPRDKKGNAWSGVYAFEAGSMLQAIVDLRQSIHNLTELIFRG